MFLENFKTSMHRCIHRCFSTSIKPGLLLANGDAMIFSQVETVWTLFSIYNIFLAFCSCLYPCFKHKFWKVNDPSNVLFFR